MIGSTRRHKCQIELWSHIKEELLSNEVIAPAVRKCGHIIEHCRAIESANMRDLSPSSVTRDGIAWLRSYMASPSLCRVANDGESDGVYVGADDGVKDGVYVGADDGVDDGV